MKSVLAGALLCLTLASLEAQADFLYEFSYGSLSDPVYGDFEADTISFTTADLLLSLGETVAADPTQDLNGFSPTEFQVWDKNGNILWFASNFDTSAPENALAALIFTVDFGIGGPRVGTFDSYNGNSASRGFRAYCSGTPCGFLYKHTSGSLTISETPVPLPAAVWLFGSGMLGIIGIARRKRAA